MSDRYGFISEPQQPAFELDDWTLQEIRFFAAVALGNGPDIWPSPYPLPICQDFFAPTRDYISENTRILSSLIERIHGDDYHMRGNMDLIPKAYSDYRLREWSNTNASAAERIWQSIDLNDNVLLRGLHALVKAQMAINHFQFADAALAYSHISLDALFNLVLKRLRASGNANPTSIDAGRYVEGEFGFPKTGLRFFEDYYDDRIRNFHADSRLGAEAIPAFCWDDAYDLWHGLKDVYYFILTGDMYEETRKERDKAKRYRRRFQENSNGEN